MWINKTMSHSPTWLSRVKRPRSLRSSSLSLVFFSYFSPPSPMESPPATPSTATFGRLQRECRHRPIHILRELSPLQHLRRPPSPKAGHHLWPQQPHRHLGRPLRLQLHLLFCSPPPLTPASEPSSASTSTMMTFFSISRCSACSLTLPSSTSSLTASAVACCRSSGTWRGSSSWIQATTDSPEICLEACVWQVYEI